MSAPSILLNARLYELLAPSLRPPLRSRDKVRRASRAALL